jgi:hypothetical protein
MRDEVKGGWRKFHDEEFHNLYFSPYIIRMIKWAGHTEGKRPTWKTKS